MDIEKTTEKLKGIGKFISGEAKKTYREFATIKVIIGVIVLLISVTLPLIYLNAIPYLIYIYPVFILFGLSVFWGFLQWAFPRYMIMKYLLGSTRIGRKVSKNNGLPPFKGL